MKTYTMAEIEEKMLERIKVTVNTIKVTGSDEAMFRFFVQKQLFEAVTGKPVEFDKDYNIITW